MRIQHNIMALNAYRQLGGNNNALAKNLEKLSSGYRINRAGDDAAGLAISEKMRAQIKGLEAAQKNANDGISLVQTAEGALTEVHSMLNRMVYLATQSANGTYDNEVDRANLDKEVQTLKEEIDRISKSTNFNGLKLLDGSMDAEATQTTGGTTDVPILQEVATNPTLEVGTKTVLHKDSPEEAKTEINVELHNVQLTEKSQEGDTIQFKVGDNTVELEFAATENLAQGILKAGESYDAEKIATAIANKFNMAGNNLIEGQEFRATATKNSIKFEQEQPPKDPTQVVNANVDVKIDYVTNPNGNPVEYTAKIKDDALKVGNKITIGGDQLTIGEGKLAGTTGLTDAFPAAGFETESGYKVSYDAAKGELKVIDPNGTLGAPALKFDSYSTALKVKGTETKGTDATKATAEYTLAKDLATGDKIEFAGDTFTVQADGSLVGGTTYDAAVANGKVTFTAKTAGVAGNSPAAEDVKVTYAAKTGVTTTTGATNSTATITLDVAAAENDTITVHGVTYTRGATGTTWAAATGAEFDIVESADGKTLTLTANTANAATDLSGEGVDYTFAARTDADAATATGGAAATNAKLEYNLDTANLKDGDKILFTDKNGADKEVIFKTDLATSLANAGINVTDLHNGAAVTGNKLTITSQGTAGAADAVPTFKLETAKKEDKSVTMTTPANADSITGTWNVRSTQNKQGAAAGGGQLASTVFDLTADMVKDGNSLTIGKETYVFKVGADSTTKAAPGQTIIDLSAYKADDAGLIDAAGAALANETGNKAFTIGYSDDGKISIHEKEGQTQYTNGELESIEEFDKLVYMKSPEVTEATGKGLTFQVGDTADDFQKVALSIKDMSSAGLDIADVSIGTIEDASAAIDKIKTAINTVSSQRGDLGAIQNRLEHTINNLGVQTENITAAESRIRDTDMAEEMMAYTKNNILVQAAQAMLAQANQVPQGILQLLQ